MEIKRKPFQGLLNIIRFNWHFYTMAMVLIFLLLLINNFFPPSFHFVIFAGIGMVVFSLLFSLCISYYIYDLSDLYQLKWIKNANHQKTLTINAGFDETSSIILQKFPSTHLTICDFYNPEKHTELSIKRARKAFPPHPSTITVTTSQLPFVDNTFDQIFAILSAHEIRDQDERITFFRELHRVMKPEGKIFVTEHIRDFNNFIVYTIGFFHFHSRKSWLTTFAKAQFNVVNEIKTTPFIATFTLTKNGNTF